MCIYWSSVWFKVATVCFVVAVLGTVLAGVNGIVCIVSKSCFLGLNTLYTLPLCFVPLIVMSLFCAIGFHVRDSVAYNERMSLLYTDRA